MASGLLPVFTCPRTLRFVKSKMTALSAFPQLMKPRLRSDARAMPWTPGVSGMSPTAFPVSMSTTTTWVACDT